MAVCSPFARHHPSHGFHTNRGESCEVRQNVIPPKNQFLSNRKSRFNTFAHARLIAPNAANRSCSDLASSANGER